MCVCICIVIYICVCIYVYVYPSTHNSARTHLDPRVRALLSVAGRRTFIHKYVYTYTYKKSPALSLCGVSCIK